MSALLRASLLLSVAAALPSCSGWRANVARAGERWSEVFAAYPGARAVCDEHITGTGIDIAWRSYATRDAPERVVAFYKETHPALVAKGDKDLLTLEARPEKTLSVVEAGPHAPSCNERLAPDERTVIVVSQALHR